MDGKRLYYSFLAGSYHVFENQKLLNKMNVFAVPDADTGTNLASTFRSIIDNCSPQISIKKTSNAISNPVEGTIIIVLREWVDYVCYIIDKVESFEQLIIESLVKARESLAKTPKKLKVLAKANVVDAGAKGFCGFY